MGTIPMYVFTQLRVSKLPILARMEECFEGQTQAYVCGIELRTRSRQ